MQHRYDHLLPEGWILLLLLAALQLPGRVFANSDYTLSPPRLHQAPLIDGFLDEPQWNEAALADGFVQQRPYTGQAASQPTEVRIFYTHQALYLGFVCHDDRPGGIVRQVLGRDALLWDDDYVAIVLDSFHDRQNGFFFQVNPNGVRRDAQFRAEAQAGQFNDDWDGVWTVRCRVTESGWQGEIEIPWRTLRFATDETVSMGFNVERQRRSVNEQSQWTPVERQFDLMRVSAAGSLEGLRAIAPGSNILLRPYLLGRIDRGDIDDDGAFDREDWEEDGEIGYDAKLGLTSSLTLDITVNTDFAQVEVDDQQVNLTRFPLFFPEKREFFLENREIFAFGSPANRAFFSRRIGLDPQGRTIPIEYGTRLTGKIGRTDVGVVDISVDGRGGTPAHRFDVVRLSRDIGERSRLGVIGINREGDDFHDFNRVFGVDSDLRPTDDLDIASYASFSHEPGDGPDKGSWGTRWRLSRPLWNATILHEVYGRDYAPRVGFLRRGDINDSALEIGWTPEPNLGWLRRIDSFAFAERISRRDGKLESRNLWVQSSLVGPGEEMLGLYVTESFERLFKPFLVGGEIEFRPGNYEFRRVGFLGNSDPSRALTADFEAELGDFYGGSLTSLRGSITAQWAPFVELALEGERNQVRVEVNALPGGELIFDADIVRVRLGIDFSNRLDLDLFSQWNGELNLFVSQARLHYLFGDESDLYVVLTDARDDNSLYLAPRRGEATVKLSYALRL